MSDPIEEALNELCLDSLEIPLAVALEHPDDGRTCELFAQIVGAIAVLRGERDAFEDALEDERARSTTIAAAEASLVSLKEALREVIASVHEFDAVAYPAGKEYVTGERYAYWQARKKLLGIARAALASSEGEGELEAIARRAVSLFPPGCQCSSYGRGLTMTRVHSAACPVHEGEADA